MQKTHIKTFIDKTATTFGATRNLLRKLEADGIKVVRSQKDRISMSKNVLRNGDMDPEVFLNRLPKEKLLEETNSVGANYGSLKTIVVPRKKDLISEGLLNEKNNITPRNILFHEAGHADKTIPRKGEGFLEGLRDYGGTDAVMDPSKRAKLEYAKTKLTVAEEIRADKNAVNLLEEMGAPERIKDYKKSRKTPMIGDKNSPLHHSAAGSYLTSLSNARAGIGKPAGAPNKLKRDYINFLNKNK